MTFPIPWQPQTATELQTAFAQLQDASAALRTVPQADLLETLDRLGQRWHPEGELVQQAQELLRGTFSDYAITAALHALSGSLNRTVLQAELARELGRVDLLESWSADELGVGFTRGYPLGVVAQVLAGNVFLNGIVGLAHSLLTRNAVLLKLSSRDTGLTALFTESLLEADTTGVLASCVTVAQWSSAEDEFNQVLRERADAIVVWGGEDAVAGYPQAKCAGNVIHYGPRLGIGVVREIDPEPASLSDLAWDVALWEQQACSSPRVLFVEDADGSGEYPRTIAGKLSNGLQVIGDPLVPRELSLDEKAEVLAFRELNDWLDQGQMYVPELGMSHTIWISSQGIPDEIPIGARTVVIVPVREMDRLPELLAVFHGKLQTAVVVAAPDQWQETIDLLVPSGVTQVTAPGSAASRFLGLPHEGEFALRRLVKLVGIDLGFGPLTAPQREAEQLTAIPHDLTNCK